MIQSIRTSKVSKVVASYLALQLILQMVQPTAMWALTGGPKQPEFNSFTPIGTSDMVSLSTGDFSYNIPVMDVGGYPLNLAYNSGITMDQEASWVGLGWNLNVGQINRGVRGIPDDFKGDEMIYENNLRDNITVNVGATVDAQVMGIELPDQVGLKIGVNLTHNNYTGLSFKPSFGLSFSLSENVSVGMQLNGSSTDGASVSPNVSLKSNSFLGGFLNGSINAGVSYNSNAGLSSFNVSTAIGANTSQVNGFDLNNFESNGDAKGILSGSGSISFSKPTLTPRKRTAFRDISGTFAASIGADVWGFDGEVEASASASVQKIKDKVKVEKAYGYDFTGFADSDDVLDYNRENDSPIGKTTLVLPVTNYTYDTYSIQAQGIGGMFRPYRSQVGQIHDEYVADESESFSLGVEIEGGTGVHSGVNFTKVSSVTSTGLWDTRALSKFTQDFETSKVADEEPVYYKYVGIKDVDNDFDMYTSKLGGYSPIALNIGGSGTLKYADNSFRVKEYSENSIAGSELKGAAKYRNITITDDKIKREERDFRTTNIQKISKQELRNFYEGDYYYKWEQRNSSAKDHHTAEIRVLKPDGSTYVFGETAYNTLKEEVTFATNATGNCETGIVNYSSNENTTNNSSGIDRFYNKVKTPAYAHTYLISAILSKDYEDMTGNGPTDDDMGGYTRFEYKKPQDKDYKWRVPYGLREASYNAGLNTDKDDQKGNYIYGEKEIKYINKIITKTHVAVFELEKREDAKGVIDSNGGLEDDTNMYQLNKIKLYSKPEAIEANMLDDDESNDKEITPIKTAHFTYSNDKLCLGIPNNENGNGKLTLDKVHFTYRNSNMGQFTPYKFNYKNSYIDKDGNEQNFDYNLKGYDIWGNFKPNNEVGCGTQDEITNAEFPFVQQEDEDLQDEYASAWSMTSIDLPSGGQIQLDYETDDYQYVQDRYAMQMFKVSGVGSSTNPTDAELQNNQLYSSSTGGDAKYIYVKLSDPVSTVEEFKQKYLRGQYLESSDSSSEKKKPIYFRFLMNMSKHGFTSNNSQDYDYVTGYLESNEAPVILKGGTYVGLPMEFKDMEGGAFGQKTINPITKAGLFFARRYLNAQSLGIERNADKQNVKDIAEDVIKSFASFADLITGPNFKLRKRSIAKKFVPKKSWIRLTVPKLNKLGGGSRVKQITMFDNWEKMQGNEDPSYNKYYGQTYDYTLDGSTTSGVATFEPNSSKENPFVEPFYNNGERLIAPKEVSYVEKPFGASFFPGPKVTYSKVTVANIAHENITAHATGKVVTEHFTSRDFPTITDHTEIDGPGNYVNDETSALGNSLRSLIGAPVRTHNYYTNSQGFMIHTNDMDSKIKMQKVFKEGDDITPISSVEYKYSIKENSPKELNNKVTVIKGDGSLQSDAEIGVDYDVVTDFRESYSEVKTKGLKTNIVVFFIGLIPVVIPVPIPTNIKHTNVARSVITTKVIHSTGILKETIATDLGATVSTFNEAWDAQTGEILLTKTVNEYNDQYYNLSMPAYWYYNHMGQASNNIGVEGTLEPNTSSGYFSYKGQDNQKYFSLGDEILGSYDNITQRFWVIGKNSSGILIMDRLGNAINKPATEADRVLGNYTTISSDIKFKIVRSGYRNQQNDKMSTVTLMKNPLFDNSNNLLPRINTNFSDPQDEKIVNASAVSYVDFWNCQCENGLPSVPYKSDGSGDLEELEIYQYGFNPYVFNVKGDWRADKSYAFLTERVNIDSSADLANTRSQGFFKDFQPYYYQTGSEWSEVEVLSNKWTNASEVTGYSPYGVELENRDALDRYSSAQYGYNYTLPTGVSSNSNYRHMGADNMEDYGFFSGLDNRFDYVAEGDVPESHFNFKRAADDDGEGGIQVTDDFAHTGLMSLEVPKGDEAIFKRPLKGQLAKETDYDGDGFDDSIDLCPYVFGYSNSPSSDYDGDGIGNACDDDAIPRITNARTTPQETYRIKRAHFTIQGNPSEVVRYYTFVNAKPRRGLKVYVNGEAKSFDKGVYSYGEITLDITGKAKVHMEVKANRAKRRRQRGRGAVTFRLLNRNSDNPVYVDGQYQKVRICPYAGKKKRSWNGDTGHYEWKCDKTY